MSIKMTVEIFAIGSNAEKGRSLERYVGAVLTTLGYRDLRFNIHKTGEEVDVCARHRISGEALKVQCKAHKDQIDTPPLRTFFGDLQKEQEKNPRTVGLFVSLSGFSGTALQWHDELSGKTKDYFRLLNGEEFFAILQETKLVCSLDALNSIIQLRTSLPVKEIVFLPTERGLFWKVVTCEEKSGHKYISLLNSQGGVSVRNDIDYLLERIPLKDEKHILLQSRHGVIKRLYEGAANSIKEISESIKESEDDVSAALDELLAQAIIVINQKEIFLRPEIDTFISLFKEAKAENSLVDFMLSKYFDSTINIMPEYTSAKYLVNLSKQERDALIRVLKVSPKALEFCLIGDSTEFRNNEEHIKKLNLTEEKVNELRKQRTQNLFRKLSTALILDIEDTNNGLLIDKNEIITTVLRFQIKLGKRFEQYLFLSDESTRMRAKVVGGIKAGELVSATGPESLLINADALASMGEEKNAMKFYDTIIELFPNSELVAAAMNNKGLIFLAKKNTKEAIPLFEKAQQYKSAQEVALKNLARCYAIDHNWEFLEKVCQLMKDEKFDSSENIDIFKNELTEQSTVKKQ
jgi:tetratricopeptide (TPR) repeat protein